MAKFDYAKCPNCGKVADGKDKVATFFGTRNDDGIPRVQSWCKECR